MSQVVATAKLSFWILVRAVFLAPPWLTRWLFFTVKPHVFAYKKSEHGNEKDTGVLVCKSTSYPAVTQWMWFKMVDDVPQVSCSAEANSLPSPSLSTTMT